MPKPPKVFSIEEEKDKVIARDPKSHRIVLGIGPERIAIDILSRLTRLFPKTGDEPASVLPMDRVNARKRKRTREK